MIEQLIFVFLLFWGLNVICDKYNIKQKLNNYATVKGNKLLYEISVCAFCFEHHLAITPTLVSLLFFTHNWIVVFMPFMVASISNIVKRV